MTTKEDLQATLRESLEGVLDLLNGLTPEQWAATTPTADHWTVRDTVSHLVTGEAGNLAIARGVASGAEMYRPDFDLARYNRRNIEKNAEQSPEELIDTLRSVREETLSFLDSLDDATLERSGRRTTGEETTVAGVFERIADHQHEHAGEIRAAIGR
ncbi:MAG: DinB family protein [Dehalococcoidia bacterium]